MGRVVRRMRRKSRRYWMLLVTPVLLFAIVLTATGIVLFPRQPVHAATGDWPTYLGSNARTGYNAGESTITPATAANLKVQWVARASAPVSGEPVEANGLVYWGDWNGVEHATDPSTGKDVWATGLGAKRGPCTPVYGVVGSATFASVLINGVTTPVIFVSGGTVTLYALNANTGVILWQKSLGSASDQAIFGSTAVFNGSVYAGIASDIDCPLVQGQLFQVNASTGVIQNTFETVPTGCIGAGVWGSPTIDETTGMLYFGTGNGNPKGCLKTEPLASSIIEVRASNLSLVASWQLTTKGALDLDIGSTPTLFNATINGVSHAMLGFVSKDGNYYAFDRTNIGAGPLWKATISIGGSGPETGNGSISSSSYDGTYLYQAGGITTIKGKKCMGSLRAMDPNTGNFIWEMCLGAPVLDSLISVPGLVVVGWAKNLYLVNSATGQELFSYVDTTSNAKFWGAATISNGVLYVGSRSGNLFAFAP